MKRKLVLSAIIAAFLTPAKATFYEVPEDVRLQANMKLVKLAYEIENTMHDLREGKLETNSFLLVPEEDRVITQRGNMTMKSSKFLSLNKTGRDSGVDDEIYNTTFINRGTELYDNLRNEINASRENRTAESWIRKLHFHTLGHALIIGYNAVDPDEWIGGIFNTTSFTFISTRRDMAFRLYEKLELNDSNIAPFLFWPLVIMDDIQPFKVQTSKVPVVQIANPIFQDHLEAYLAEEENPYSGSESLKIYDHMRTILSENGFSQDEVDEMDTSGQFVACYNLFLDRTLEEMEEYPAFKNSLLEIKIKNAYL